VSRPDRIAYALSVSVVLWTVFLAVWKGGP